MIKTQKAFTITELIFVIVIIGILAMVAMPKLVATRNDAKISTCVENVTIFIRDIASYYTSQGNYALHLSDMTSVEVYETIPITSDGDAGEYYFVCDKIKSVITPTDAALTFKFSKVSDGVSTERTNLNVTAVSVIRGSVDGDLGHLLKVKNIASDGLGIDHPITGIRIKR